MTDSRPETNNRLGAETSPYLLQHKDNPVHWRPWGAAALNEARQAKKPILLSIGYAACHWCHVMAHESFEDDDVAAVMNDLFVNIKVDREERPDIDTIYMQALHHLGEQGGWPLTMFLTPAGEPFWGGTYFPKTPRYGRPGFVQVLKEVSRIFRDEPDKIENNRTALLDRLKAAAQAGQAVNLSQDSFNSAAQKLLTIVDPVLGGTQGAPKFPQTAFLELLWRGGRHLEDERFTSAVENTLTKMAQGGIYDHLGGGFSRYSVDEHWLVPHFEKMLYDNALLIDLMALVWRQTQAPLLAARTEESIGWMLREMRDPAGGFYSSLDADSEGEEGKFYVWTAKDVQAVLETDFAKFAVRYDVTAKGNWEGKVVLNRSRSPDWLGDHEEARLAALRAKLLDTRETRLRPGLDDKILADWNGLAIRALVNAGFAFEREDWVGAARQAFDFICETMSEGTRLLHSYRAGKAAQKGLLSDYANMMRAGLALYRQHASPEIMDRVLAWHDVLEGRFIAADGSYFMTPDDADDLIVRPKSALDDATPNGNSIAAENCITLWHLTGKSDFRDRAEAILSAYGDQAMAQLFGFAALFNSLDLALNAVELIIVEPQPQTSRGNALLAVQRKIANPNIIVRRIEDGAVLPPDHPAQGKTSLNGQAAAYLCTHKGCSLPVTTPEELAARLAERLGG